MDLKSVYCMDLKSMFCADLKIDCVLCGFEDQEFVPCGTED